MNDAIAAASRAAAKHMANNHGTGVVADVEALLQAPDGAHRPGQYLDPVSLGGLIVAIATLAWTIYSDRQKGKSNLSQDILTRHVRIELRERNVAYQKEQDRIVEIIVAELIRVAPHNNP